MSGYNPSKTTWVNPNIEYLFNTDIIEYDIQDAGFNLIQQYQLLPASKIEELTRLQKGLDRHIAVGMLQRDDKDFSKRLGEKFAEIRALFLHANDLTDNDIISVKKDAIYTIGTCKKTTFGKIKFRPKHHYTSYLRLTQIQNLELYYSSEGIDVKGMSEMSVNKHRLYWMEFFRELFPMIEDQNSLVKRRFIKFLDQYKNDQLDEAYYVEFNNMSRDTNKLFNYQRILIPIAQILLREVS